MPPYKKQKLYDSGDEKVQGAQLHIRPDDGSDSGSDMEDFSASDSDKSLDTSDAVSTIRRQKSRQTSKRKIRATGASNFGAALQSLLNTNTPSALPLSLKPSINRKRNDEKLEIKAKKVFQVERKEKEDKGRIRDVIGGWGGASERTLRKVAQRGVVKLFNAIQQSQATASAAAEETKAARGSGKPTLPAPVIDSKTKAKNKSKDKDKANIIGQGKKGTVDRDDFFDMIRSGGVVSKV